MAVRVSIELPVDAATAWGELEAIEDHVQWMADAVRLDFATDQHRGVGTEIVVATKIGPFRTNDRMLFTGWEPPVRLAVDHVGLFTGAGCFTLEPVDAARTRLTWTEDVRFPWYLGGRIAAFAASPVLRWIWGRNLKRLRDRLSSR